MAVAREIIDRFIEDYRVCTGSNTDRFICPITLQAVPDEEVIKGHLLNQAFFDASGKTVPQWKRVDGFFGETVEPDLIDHLNLKDKTDADLLSGADEFYIEFADGTRAEAFWAGSRSAQSAKDRFPNSYRGVDIFSVVKMFFTGYDPNGDPTYIFFYPVRQTTNELPVHDHRSNDQGGFAFAVYHPGTSLPQAPFSI